MFEENTPEGARATLHMRIYLCTPHLPPFPQSSLTSPRHTLSHMLLASPNEGITAHAVIPYIYIYIVSTTQDTQHLNLGTRTVLSQFSVAMFSVLLPSSTQHLYRPTATLFLVSPWQPRTVARKRFPPCSRRRGSRIRRLSLTSYRADVVRLYVRFAVSSSAVSQFELLGFLFPEWITENGFI